MKILDHKLSMWNAALTTISWDPFTDFTGRRHLLASTLIQTHVYILQNHSRQHACLSVFFAEFAPRHYRCKPILKSQKAVSAAKWLPSKYDYVQVNDVLDKDKKQANQSSSYSS